MTKAMFTLQSDDGWSLPSSSTQRGQAKSQIFGGIRNHTSRYISWGLCSPGPWWAVSYGRSDEEHGHYEDGGWEVHCEDKNESRVKVANIWQWQYDGKSTSDNPRHDCEQEVVDMLSFRPFKNITHLADLQIYRLWPLRGISHK